MFSQAFKLQLIEYEGRDFMFFNENGEEVRDSEPIRLHIRGNLPGRDTNCTRYVSLRMTFRKFMSCLSYWMRGTNFAHEEEIKLTRMDSCEISIRDALEENGTLADMCFYDELCLKVEDCSGVPE